jgi:hypothetical protein
MVKLMTHGEVERRLSLDHDPLDLSIEKWQRLLQAVETGQEIRRAHLTFDTCGLCMATPLPDDEQDDDCVSCPYYEYWGESCCEGKEPFLKAYNSYFCGTDDIPWIKAKSQEMIQALEEVKESR